VSVNGTEVKFTCENGVITTEGEPLTVPGGGGIAPEPGNKPGGGERDGNDNRTNPLRAGGGGTPTPVTPVLPIDPDEPGNPETPENPENPEDSSGEVFTDIAGHWASEEIMKTHTRGIFNGGGDGLFRPESMITRAEITAILVRALDISEEGGGDGVFTDVTAEEWYADAAAGAAKAGLIHGYEDGSFGADNIVTRQEAAKMLVAACAYLGIPTEERAAIDQFTDASVIEEWAADAVSAVVGIGLMQGVGGGRFAPNEGATRAQGAVIISRLLDLAGKGVEHE
jgi:hypothetical protein